MTRLENLYSVIWRGFDPGYNRTQSGNHIDTIGALCIEMFRDPFEDTHRLVLADALDERGLGDDKDRAEFIRLQCELFKYPQQVYWLENMPVEQWEGDPEEGVLLQRLEPLVKRHTELCKQYVRDCAKWSSKFVVRVTGNSPLRVPQWQWGWTKGFVSDLEVPLPHFIRWVEHFFRNQPVTKVVLTGVVRQNVVYENANRGYEDVYRIPWDELDMPWCKLRGCVAGHRQHAHVSEDQFSDILVNYGRKVVSLPPLPNRKIARCVRP